MIEYLKWLWNIHKKPPACTHERVRCLHGDEINYQRGRRSACLDCYLILDPLPEYCYYTKELHGSYRGPEDSPFGPDDYFKMDP